jgi:uncharacterized protein YicC (UPF0701 family)
MATRPKSPDTVMAIEVEMQAEKASALRRLGARIESLLAELAQLERELPTLRGPQREQCIARHRELRAEAEKQRWYLVIQREAMGLRQHADLDDIYPLPPAVH